MLKVLDCQSTSPEIRACSMPPTEKRKMSLLVSEETFHQKLRAPGPVTMVCMEFEALSPVAPLRAASTPSLETTDWPIQPEGPRVVQVNVVVSRASGKDKSGGQLRSAGGLVTLPAE